MKEDIFKKEAFVHYKYFINLAQKMTQNPLDAEDLVQDTYIRAYKFFDTFEPGSNCKAWIFKIMKNLFINYSIKKKSRPLISLESTNIQTGVWYDDPRVTRYELLKLMEKIKDEYRAVIILYHLEDYSLLEISKALNWPLGTVKSRLHRARREFKKILLKSQI
ncbi:MAG: RNA polymerase sigma factor [Chlorobi bacterium]|nr:RNA polymerase sigma factor [Chlorobiota bacterium]MCI0715516.1 RNA polymerase sigma factor [Chlorobiota bacterium]